MSTTYTYLYIRSIYIYIYRSIYILYVNYRSEGMEGTDDAAE